MTLLSGTQLPPHLVEVAALGAVTSGDTRFGSARGCGPGQIPACIWGFMATRSRAVWRLRQRGGLGFGWLAPRVRYSAAFWLLVGRGRDRMADGLCRYCDGLLRCPQTGGWLAMAWAFACSCLSTSGGSVLATRICQ